MPEKELAFDFDSGEISEVKEVKVEKKPKPKKEVKEQSKSKQPKKFKGIKIFRYGAIDIKTELDIDENTEYTDQELVHKLNAAGYYEFKERDTTFAFNQERGILAVNIKGNTKG
ncbi:hypothetical protein KHQ81_12970 [Mycoplasmatota bacterium]|nr:hypothetical protein KHQ81_12970 [Mycoplasmatota bacterium]